MDKHHNAAIFITLVICFLVMFGLFNAENRTINSNTPAVQYNVQMILKAKSNPPAFWTIVEQGALVAAKEYGVKCVITGPAAEEDIDQQIQLVEKAISARPDAIILAASDFNRLAPVCQKITEAGIKLIMVDSDVNFEGKHGMVGTDNIELGKKLAEQVDQLIGPNDKFGVIGHIKTVTTATEREKGLRENVINAEKRIVGVAFGNSSVQLSRQQAVEMLRAHPEVRCMVGLNESSALGIAYALLDLHLEGKVKLVACDSSQEMIQMMERGVIQVFVVQNPFNMGYVSVKEAVSVLQKKEIPRFYDTKSVVVTKKTLYTEENQKLLFPFTETNDPKEEEKKQ